MGVVIGINIRKKPEGEYVYSIQLRNRQKGSAGAALEEFSNRENSRHGPSYRVPTGISREQYNGSQAKNQAEKTKEIACVDKSGPSHFVTGKQRSGSEQSDTKPQGVYPYMNASTEVSIAKLLQVVKENYQSILPQSVLSQMGLKRNPEGYYSGKVKFSLEDQKIDWAGGPQTG